jgi:flagellar basal-body rod modification protein FlgD
MMDINNNAASIKAQNALLDKLGISNSATAKAEAKDELGQDEFLKLMTTQLQNQDPFAPMDNGDFIAQMAQFSSVSGINQLNDTMGAMAGQIEQFRIATASSMMGHSVLVPGDTARADENGEIHGVMDLDGTSIDTKVTYTDAVTGAVLKTADMGAQASGLVGFAWTDLPDEYKDGSKSIKVEVSVNKGEGPESLQPSIFSQVIGASMDGPNGGVMYELPDNGQVSAEEVLRFRI